MLKPYRSKTERSRRMGRLYKDRSSRKRDQECKKRVRDSKEAKKRENWKFEDEAVEDFREMNGTCKEEIRKEKRKFEEEDQLKDGNTQDKRARRRQRLMEGDKAMIEDVRIVEDESISTISHEVLETPTTSGNLSLEALRKAKEALQMQMSEKLKKKKIPLVLLKPKLDVDPHSNPHYDVRMGINKAKLFRPKRTSFQFVEEGGWSKASKEAEETRFEREFGEVQQREKTKERNLDPIPEVEWWDVSLMHSGHYKDVSGDITKQKLKMDKVTAYVEHCLPIDPPAEHAPPPPQPLMLTKKEKKKLRTKCRLTKENLRRDMIRQGLFEPPAPKIKLSNLMKVLGSKAIQDPTRLEIQIRREAAERKQAHIDRNIAGKLTSAELHEKKKKKLFDNLRTLETIVSVYKINDLSHKQTHRKVYDNANDNQLTGCMVIAEGISIVVVEGGSKPIKRFRNLMLRRIHWATPMANEEKNEDKPENKCVLLWQGSVSRPIFNSFFVRECITEAAAKNYFSDAGVVHYWDLAVNYSDDQI